MVAASPILFPRERLFARFDGCLAAPITLLHGAAGSGKSTALRHYLETRATAHVTFDVSADHATPATFLRGLADALAPAAPAMALTAAGVVDRFDAATALAWAEEHLNRVASVIVVDGLEHALADAESAAFIVGLLDAATLPHWVLVTRDADALPVARWFANERMVLPIGERDLQLTLDEIAPLARHHDEATLRALLERTSGRPVAVAAALLADGPPRDEVDWFGLTVESTLARPGADRDAFAAAALAGSFDAALLAELGFDGHACIAVLQAAGMVFAADDRWTVYDGYREVLLRNVDAAAPEAVAHALERAGRWREAAVLLLRNGAVEPLAALIDRVGFEALDVDGPTVKRIFAVVPETVLTRYPTALGVRAAVAAADDVFDMAEAWFGMAIAAADPAARRAIVIRYGLDLVRRDRPDAVTVLEAEVAGGTDAAHDPVLLGLLATAYSNQSAGRTDEARALMRRSLQHFDDVRGDAARSRLLHQAAYVALADKDYVGAKALAEQSYAIAAAAHLHEAAARVVSVLYVVAIDVEDDVPAARRHLARLVESARLAGSTVLRVYALVALYEIEAIAGHADAMMRLDADLRASRIALDGLTDQTLLPAQALRAGWDGRFEHAWTLLAAGAERIPEDDRRAQRCAEAAMYAAAAGLRGEAARMMRRARAALRLIDPSDRWALHAAAFLAIAEVLLAHDARARSAVAGLRQAARTAGRRFGALVNAVAALHERWTGGSSAALADALDALDAHDLGGIARLIIALPLPSTTRGRAILLGDIEKRVLQLVAAGLTSKEIGAELGRSAQTVDVHVRAICKKLRCSGRRQAVALALAEGIITDRRGGLR